MSFSDPKWQFMPDRYRENWPQRFKDEALAAISKDALVLDVGGGAKPIIAPDERPANTFYVGLDIEADEMLKAPDGSYDETHVARIESLPDDLLGRFDLAVSWQVLEHVDSIEDALEGTRASLKPGGTFVAMLTGGRAWFALANRVVPDSVAEFGMKRLLGREPETVFHANYDVSTRSELLQQLHRWSSARIVPQFTGASYLKFSRPLAWTYVNGYENLLVKNEKSDWATHYMLVATK